VGKTRSIARCIRVSLNGDTKWEPDTASTICGTPVDFVVRWCGCRRSIASKVDAVDRSAETVAVDTGMEA
jgi:hypothetical protein